jgi:D-2-hydroxyacid dehydrogenase (NADP+)
VSVLGGMIALDRGFVAQWEAQKRHAWQPLDELGGPPEFAGRTAIVVGLGPIGREIARLARAFGLRVIGVRRSAEPVAECDETIAYDGLRGRLPHADWLVLACPLSETTRALIDASALASLPRGARIVNVARGEVIVESALIEALASGHLGGAWLDVFHHEPLDAASPLWDLPNVIVSPHSSSRSSGHYDRVLEIFLDNLARLRDGRPLRNVARPGQA